MTHVVRIETRTEKPSDDHPDGVLAGQVFEVELSAANKLYPNAKVLSNADGTPYKAPVVAGKDDKK